MTVLTILTIKVMLSVDSNPFSLEVSRLILPILLLKSPIRSLSLSLRCLWRLVIIENNPISITVTLEHPIHIMTHKNGKDEVYLRHNVVNASGYVLVVKESIVLDAINKRGGYYPAMMMVFWMICWMQYTKNMRTVHQLNMRHAMKRKKTRRRQMKNWKGSPTTSARMAIGMIASARVIRIFLAFAWPGVGGSRAGGQHTAPILNNNYREYNDIQVRVDGIL